VNPLGQPAAADFGQCREDRILELRQDKANEPGALDRVGMPGQRSGAAHRCRVCANVGYPQCEQHHFGSRGA
jgi:hypothetical protein